MEIVNYRSYYLLAHKWCLKKKITMLANSDVHDPMNLTYDFPGGEHRPITLVFAKERSKQGIKDALFARRTAVYDKNLLIGEEKYLRPIFNQSIEILNPEITMKGKSNQYIQICNNSDIPFELVVAGNVKNMEAPKEIILYGDKTVLFSVKSKVKGQAGRKKVSFPYTVKNLLIEPDEGLPVELKVDINFVDSQKK